MRVHPEVGRVKARRSRPAGSADARAGREGQQRDRQVVQMADPEPGPLEEREEDEDPARADKCQASQEAPPLSGPGHGLTFRAIPRPGITRSSGLRQVFRASGDLSLATRNLELWQKVDRKSTRLNS